MTMLPVRIGVIGIGNIGSAHAKALSEHNVEGAVLGALCDISEEKRAYAVERYPTVSIYESTEKLFASHSVDAVIVAVPHPLHAEICLQALEAGLHVLSEKPIDITVTKAQQLNEAFSRSDRVFGIMFNQRTNPLFQKAREIVKGGLLGQMKRNVWIITNWYRSQEYYDSGSWRATWSGEGGGVLLNQAPHNLDLWQWICGMPVALRATCHCAKYHNIEVEDDATLIARYANGAEGVFITSTGEYPGTNRLEISGTKGKLVLESGVLKWWKLPHDERDFCFGKAPVPHSTDVEYEEIALPSPKGAHAAILSDFCRAIQTGSPLLAPGTDGIYQLSLSNAAYLSQWTGKEVSIPFDTELFDHLLQERAKASKGPHSANNEKASEEYKERWQVNW